MKKAFPIGALDKTKRFIKTVTGWVSVKKMAGGDISKLHDILGDAQSIFKGEMILLSDAPEIPKAPTAAPGKFTTIYDAQVAWLKKEITHAEFLREQAGMYIAGIISKKHSNIKIK